MTALRKAGIDQSGIAEAIVKAIDALDSTGLDRLGAWQPLAELSSATEFDAIGADPASVVLADTRFEANADIYVVLHYGAGEDAASLSDSYLATVYGTIDGGEVSIDEIVVDTRPFYS